MPEIAVIVPVYNCEKYIASCIESVIRQTFQNWELILVNDGSTDKSGEICHTYAKQDKRIKVIEKENGGGGGEARNVGVSQANAPFLMFLDSDDCYFPEMLETVYTEQKKGDYDVVVTGYEEWIEETQETGEQVFYQEQTLKTQKEVRDFFVRHYPEGLLGFPWNKLYRTSIIKQYHLAFPKMRRLEDGIFNVLYFEKCQTCRMLSAVLHRYRESRQVELRKLPYDFFDIMKVFVNQYFDTLKTWGYTQQNSERSMAEYFQNDFVCCLENICLPVWDKTSKEKMDDIRQLRKENLVVYMLQKDRNSTGRYTRMVLDFFEKEQYTAMKSCIRLKLILKTRFARLFYLLKGKMN